MIRNEYASLMCELVMIALCWVGCAYILIAYGAEKTRVDPCTDCYGATGCRGSEPLR